ncbi:hypothetical protein Poli38472_011079 [Pythium oligandrum]|uniref:Uncharacterized protein n=1 Tax=Pythium oligandrum TaxID=41045 RepID=A0A8K1CQM4_PYTOL|nr:hypothetical protein Poli38472_011079 [Pythium oligandrum]|eukprot:TMW67459.1 hypothetical protein Poli38472_011079 [Pythium oligandrum]
MESLQDALKEQAIAALQGAVRSLTATEGPPNKVLIAVDESDHVILEVLAYGGGGKLIFDELNVTRLVSVNSTGMDPATVRNQIGLPKVLSSSGPVAWPAHHVVFVLPPSAAVATFLARSLLPVIERMGDADTLPCSVLWLPAATPECTFEMERVGLAGTIQQANLPLGLIPVDRNIAALCQDSVFADLYVRGDEHALSEVVKSVLAIEQHSASSGVAIPEITCHGAFAERVKAMLDMAHRMQRQRRSTGGSGNAFFRRLIMIDRMEDPLSMLLTPMTYEGLLDGLIGLNHGVVSFERVKADDESSASNSSETETVKVIMNHLDQLFEDMRDVNINHLISHRLAQTAQQLVSESRLNVKAQPETTSNRTTVSSPRSSRAALDEVKALLKKVPHLVKQKRSLGNHLTLVQQIQQRSQDHALRSCVETEMAILSTGMKRGIRLPSSSSVAKGVDRFLEEALLRDPPLLGLYDMLKLLCLQSLASGGLKEDKLQWYRRQLCHTYGHQVLPLLVQLEKLELLSTKNTLDYPRRRGDLALLRAVVDDEGEEVSDQNAKDIHFMFPYTGYAPMSVRLVQRTLGIKFKGPKDIFGLGGAAASASSGGSPSRPKGSPSAAKTPVLVYYIGGVTVAELAAYRFLNATQGEFEFFVATTSVCNGSRLLRAI